MRTLLFEVDEVKTSIVAVQVEDHVAIQDAEHAAIAYLNFEAAPKGTSDEHDRELDTYKLALERAGIENGYRQVKVYRGDAALVIKGIYA